jgi:hypothetical protein
VGSSSESEETFTVDRTWGVRRLSITATLLPLFASAVGTVVVVAGVVGIVRPWGGNPRCSFIVTTACGLLIATTGLLAYAYIVIRVDSLKDGSYRFMSRRRQMVVRPETIVSLYGSRVVYDPLGTFPFRMKTKTGSVLINRHMPCGEELEDELRQENPNLVARQAWIGTIHLW